MSASRVTSDAPVRLKCAVCGGHAGYFKQHGNMDDGWGICRRCVVWVATTHPRPASAEQIREYYGAEGVNYAAKDEGGAA